MVKIIIFMLISISCHKKEVEVKKDVQKNILQNKIEQAPLPPRVIPIFKGLNHPTQGQSYRLTFLNSNPHHLQLKEIEIWGETQQYKIKSTAEKLFDGNYKNYYDFGPNLPQTIEFSEQNGLPFSIHAMKFIPHFFRGEENTPSEFKLEAFINNQYQEIYYAKNLITDIIDIWTPHLPTFFKIIQPVCHELEEIDHLGICHTKRIFCQDIEDQFNEEFRPCSIRIENEEIYCIKSANIRDCRMELYKGMNISYCDVFKNFLVNPQSRLEIYFNQKKIFEQFCATPIQ